MSTRRILAIRTEAGFDYVILTCGNEEDTIANLEANFQEEAQFADLLKSGGMISIDGIKAEYFDHHIPVEHADDFNQLIRNKIVNAHLLTIYDPSLNARKEVDAYNEDPFNSDYFFFEGRENDGPFIHIHDEEEELLRIGIERDRKEAEAIRKAA